MRFDVHVGIDYSGRDHATSRTSALQVYAATNVAEPERILSPASVRKSAKNWNRREIAEWLIGEARKDRTFIAGIDHGFSFPISYFERYRISDWQMFLDDFCQYWPTDQDSMSVQFLRDRKGGPPDRSGSNRDLRLSERWTSSAKSVFQFDVQGSVAKSTHAGLPWLRRIREEVGDRLHFWPFDGWEIADNKSVLVEVFPSIFRNRYARDQRSVDQQDAYSTARWLSESDDQGFLDQFFHPPLSDRERQIADLEGWIFGIM